MLRRGSWRCMWRPGYSRRSLPVHPPPQICKGEETHSGLAGFEFLMSCEADGKKLITTILYLLFLALHTPPSASECPAWELRHHRAVEHHHEMGIPPKSQAPVGWWKGRGKQTAEAAQPHRLHISLSTP